TRGSHAGAHPENGGPAPSVRSNVLGPGGGEPNAINPDGDSGRGVARRLCVKVIRNRGCLRLANSVSVLHLPTARDGSAGYICEGCGTSWRSGSEADERSNRYRRGNHRILARSVSCRRRRPGGRSTIATQRPDERYRAGQHPEEMRHTVSPNSSCELEFSWISLSIFNLDIAIPSNGFRKPGGVSNRRYDIGP